MRKNSGITQQELGNMLGVSNRAVSKWETGLALPSTENIYKLSRIFGVPVDHFFAAPIKAQGDLSNADVQMGMKSLKGIYRIGRGPSSSHTIGPERACRIFRQNNPTADRFKAILYGSLAKTGVGHGTDRVVKKTFEPFPCEIVFDYNGGVLPHPNTMDIYAYRMSEQIAKSRVASVGGGKIVIDGVEYGEGEDVYSERSFEKISDYCTRENIRLWQYVERVEGKEITEYLSDVWKEMKRSIADGLADDGILPGGLEVQKRAKQLYGKQHIDESAETRENRMVCAYAFAVSDSHSVCTLYT